ncbi:hypothetical protein [Geobacter sp. SVR]|uniref:hypothetical protein n=1 Tax=Geobacter sp. SVR TaxID=2495594 RepID=UPI001566FD7F|nr:hypothetical protein [Geobacter sp. SVR]
MAKQLKLKSETQSDVRAKVGFQRFNIQMPCYRDQIFTEADQANPYKKMTQAYKELVYRDRPYYLFMTLTFPLTMSYFHRCKYTSRFIKKHNKMIFGPDYLKRDDHMEGYAFFEEHPSIEFPDRYHVHLLVNSNYRYAGWNLKTHTDIFHKAADKVVVGGQKVFKHDCIDIREAGNDLRIRYCFKQIEDRNLDHLKIIGKNGLSDSF